MLRSPTVLRRDLRGEIFRQDRDFFGALPQRRQHNRKNIDAVKQIRAERSLPDQFLEIAVRRDNHARVHRNRLVATDAFDFALFQHAQQLRLHRERHVADFVEKQRAAAGLLELADVPACRASERTLFMAEQLGFDQLARHGGAIERHERPGAARAFLVNGARDELFARSGFTLDRHARFTRGHTLHLRQQPLHHRPGPDDVVLAEAAAQVAVFLLEVPQPQDVLRGDEEPFR